MNKYFSVFVLSGMLAVTPVIMPKAWRYAIAQGETTTPRPMVTQSIGLTIKALELVDAMTQGNFSAALEQYSPDAQEGLTPEDLQQNWQDIVNAYGKLNQQLGTRTRQWNQPGDAGVVIITCEFEKGIQDLLIEFNSDNQVVNFNIFGD